MTLVEFLTARLDEDEAEAEAAYHALSDNPVNVDPDYGGHVIGSEPYDRVDREVAAKRAIVSRFADTCYPDVNADAWTVMKATLADLAAVYADHPDYREEWRP